MLRRHISEGPSVRWGLFLWVGLGVAVAAPLGCATDRGQHEDTIRLLYEAAQVIPPIRKGVWRTEFANATGESVRLRADAGPYGNVRLEFGAEEKSVLACPNREFLYVKELRRDADGETLYVLLSEKSLDDYPEQWVYPFDLVRRTSLSPSRFRAKVERR
jgi:hypothetical protein